MGGKKRTRDEPEVELAVKKDAKKAKKDAKKKKEKKEKKAKKEKKELKKKEEKRAEQQEDSDNSEDERPDADNAQDVKKIQSEERQLSKAAELIKLRMEKFEKKLAKNPHDMRIKNKLNALEEELEAEMAKPADAAEETEAESKADAESPSVAKKTPPPPPTEVSETVFVGGLPFNVDEETLLQVFHDCGEVQAVRFGHDSAGEFKRYAHVDFATIDDAKKALEKAGEKVLNRKIRIEPAARGAGGAAGTASGAAAAHDDSAAEGSAQGQGHGKSRSQNKDSATAKPFVAPEAPAPNPDNVNRCFVGNLPFGIDETTLNACFEEHEIQPSYVNWVTDRETGNFYGSSFIVFNTAEDAAWAVAYSNAGFCIQDRPIRIEYCPHRNKSKGGAGGASRPTRPPSTRPEGGTKAVFFGNLSFDLDPSGDQIHEFCKPFGPIKALRWIEDKETGAFKGAAFADFFTEDVVDQVVEKLNGKKLLGRPVRVDYA
ncbi:RNA-binding protein 34 [Hondaea fermentalgiana]|uniref:RNA-binding protein 34 n=1 Tax=Hondaea fermentalgiana TaxID=2315210 RepID=A0A2R5G560_9STRA|nr:RNA-binding protein 34 [Hondaea fermentalgiana]|eukprot:GBG26166.1 RNA-binding protein 34 [Hondaea fermentalgiana]